MVRQGNRADRFRGLEARSEPGEGEMRPVGTWGEPTVTESPLAGHPVGPARSTRPPRALVAGLAALTLAVAALLLPGPSGMPIGVGQDAPAEVRVAGIEPDSFDPALAGDVASGAILANLYEGLTGFDPALNVRPALASSWEADPEWRRIVFHLRDGLTFSDGSALRPGDVVRSWLRLLRARAPLAGLLGDVEGSAECGPASCDPSKVGIKALGDGVEVRFHRPAPWFVAATASAALAVVPSTIDPQGVSMRPGDFVGSGAYVLEAVNLTSLTLLGNRHYWAGPPPIDRVVVVTAAEQGTLSAFRDGELDYTEIPDFEARWIRYDKAVGPALRSEPSLSVEYYGFDTTRPPFDDARVRRAFALAVDWRGLARAAGGGQEPATSLVPPGIPGRSGLDLLPPYDPDEARRLLAQAGYPGGAGFPDVALQTSGSRYDEAIRAAIARELEVALRGEILADFLARMLGEDRPAMWSIAWIADYPDPYDFLGVLLGGGQVSNFGRWQNAAFDAALERAGTAATAAQRARAYEEAELIVQAEAPIVPIAYSTSWALARDGLLGAQTGGIGIVRFAGLAWSEE